MNALHVHHKRTARAVHTGMHMQCKAQYICSAQCNAACMQRAEGRGQRAEVKESRALRARIPPVLAAANSLPLVDPPQDRCQLTNRGGRHG